MPTNPASPAGLSDPIKQRLWRAFRDEVLAAGLSIAPDCEHQVKAFIDGGVKQLLKIHAENDQITQAEDAIRTVAQKMIEEAAKDESSVVTASVFFSVLDYICPLFPFC